MQSLVALDAAGGIAPAKASHEIEFLLLRFFDRRLGHSITCGIHRHRLLAEDVLSCLDRRSEVQRTEPRRSGEQHHVHSAIDEPLIGIQTGELFIRLHIDPVRKLGGKVLDAVLDLRVEGVGHRHDF